MAETAELQGYEIFVRVWYAGSGMNQPDEEHKPLGPFPTLKAARDEYDALGWGRNFVARKMIELRPITPR